MIAEKNDNKRDLELIREVKNGDEEAFTELYRHYFTELCEFAYRYVKSPDLSEEIVQDVFLDIWRRRKEWGPKESPRSYIYRSVRNRALDYLKHRNVEIKWENESKLSNNQCSHSPEQVYVGHELSRIIEQTLANLPDRRKIIFFLSREHDLTYREISDVLGISVKTVETQMGRSLKALKEALEGYLS